MMIIMIASCGLRLDNENSEGWCWLVTWSAIVCPTSVLLWFCLIHTAFTALFANEFQADQPDNVMSDLIAQAFASVSILVTNEPQVLSWSDGK